MGVRGVPKSSSSVFQCVSLYFFRPSLVANPPACYRSLSGPSDPKCPRSVPRGVFAALRAPGSGVSKRCPRSVWDTFSHSGDTLATLFSPKDTPRDTPGTLRASRARETPAAGQGVRNSLAQLASANTLMSCE